jgi:hypothetical protein
MAWPTVFATLAQGNQNLSLFDGMFNAVGAVVFIPCTASGQNAVTLTQKANTPTVSAYTDLSPVFVWVQPQTSTGSVTLGLTGLGLLNAYRNNGQTLCGSGDLVAGSAYQAFALSSLNSGAGGFVVDAFSTVASGGVLVTSTVYSGSQTITIPASATKGFVRMWGATGGSGGSGGNGFSGATGAGGYLEKLLTGMTPGNTLIYTQGGAGAAGTNAPGNGGNGGTTTLASGTQTITTLTCSGSNGSLGTSSQSTGTVGGTATNGDLNITGQSGVSMVAATPLNGCTLPGGRNVFSIGADGATATGQGNAGNPGGLAITWFT